ncbi:DUF3817 domain-containing protein [Olivibacter sp. SDN3]|uniref:DUF3817 domain-containing protein n=1 Tax=Olivibacter sp. SDN3 TaxID=2764720 RepID=UPI00165166AA|nr:DUF3817 domain-containing protein [Olivibacter sp. SDN3]QNL51480.1 DUF3817 domain-containing protein [Olivibacter sp. SDN3]
MSNSTASTNSSLNNFRKVALLEGISFILLVFIAMPLKYWADFPLAVKYVGWAHGILFMGYLFMLIQCSIAYSWKFGRVVLFFVASLLPFAPFFVEKKLKEETR